MTTTTIGSGTIDNGPTINYGDTILNYGTVDNARVYSQLVTEAGAIDNNTNLGFFGTLTVDFGGTSLDAHVGDGGSAIIEGLAENMTLYGGTATVVGGTLENPYTGGLKTAGEIDVYSGLVIGTTFNIGSSYEYVYGGTVSNGFFGNGANITDYTGGHDIGTTLASAAVEVIYGGSSSFATAIDADIDLLSGTQYDASIGTLAFDAIAGGMALGTTINAGGKQNIEGGTVTGDVIESGATVTQMSGTLLGITGNGGTLGATTLDGGTLILESGTQDGTISLTSLGGIVMDDETSASLIISGFERAAPYPSGGGRLQ